MDRIVLESPASIMEDANNSYLIRRQDDVALIDTGASSPDIRSTFAEGLEGYGVSPSDIDTILLTHGHPDHAGLAGWVQRQSGATVYLHEGDWRHLRERGSEASDSEDDMPLKDWGIPDRIQTEIYDSRREAGDSTLGLYDPPDTIEPLTDGQQIQVGDLSLDVVHTPGHSKGSVVFRMDHTDGQEAFTGDTILPTYTANIGADQRLDDPLGQYFSAIRELGRELDLGWPGHGPMIDDPAARVNAIISHHRERLNGILQVVNRIGEATVWETCLEVFDDLQGIHRVLAAAEIDAHLTYLKQNGLVENVGNKYRALSESVKQLDDPLIMS